MIGLLGQDQIIYKLKNKKKGNIMRKIVKYVNKKKDGVIIEKHGIKYKRVDLGGHTMDIRIKSEKEFKNDVKLFQNN